MTPAQQHYAQTMTQLAALHRQRQAAIRSAARWLTATAVLSLLTGTLGLYSMCAGLL